MFHTFYYSDILCGKKHLDVTIFSEISSVFGYIASFIYLFVCVQSASHLMSNINVSGTIFLGLVFHNFEPYPYPIMLNLKIYQSVVLKVVQLFPKSNLLASVSGFCLRIYEQILARGKLPNCHRNLILQIRFQNSKLYHQIILFCSKSKSSSKSKYSNPKSSISSKSQNKLGQNSINIWSRLKFIPKEN